MTQTQARHSGQVMGYITSQSFFTLWFFQLMQKRKEGSFV